jgi:hypothetical protein
MDAKDIRNGSLTSLAAIGVQRGVSKWREDGRSPFALQADHL